MGRGIGGFFGAAKRKAMGFGSGYCYYTDKKLECNKKPSKASYFSPEEIEALKSIPKEQIGRVLFKSQRTLVGGNTVSGGTTINSSRTKPRLGPSNR